MNYCDNPVFIIPAVLKLQNKQIELIEIPNWPFTFPNAKHYNTA